MKVLHFIPSFGSGGAERQLSLLAPALQARGLEMHVAHLATGPNHLVVAESDVHMHRLHATSNHDLRLTWQSMSLIRGVRPDIVHTWLPQMDIIGGGAAIVLRKPLVLSERSSAGAYPPNWKHRVRVQVGLRADAIIANSEGGIAYWREQGATGALHLIRNAIVPSGIGLAPPAVQATDDLILFVGRLSPEKNVICLLDAFIEVARRRPGVEIRMLGDGPLQDLLSQRLNASGQAGRIQLCNFVTNVADWLRAAKLCVSVSEFEGQPNAVLEAASMGCPLLLSDIPAHRELLGNSEAAYVDARRATDIAEAIVHALDDGPAAQQRACRAQQSVSRFTLKHVASAYIDAYARLLSSAGH